MSLHLPKYKKKTLDHALTKYTKPKYVYIPLINDLDTNITLLVKKGDYVYKGGIVARRKSPYKIPLLSSVSGTVVGFEEHYVYNGQVVKCVKIENDYKEQELDVKKNKKLTEIKKSEFIELIKERGIIGMGGSGFPTFAKYDVKRKINTLIINAVECEPYITADSKIILDYADEILETIDAIMEINAIEECFIAVKKNDYKVIQELNNHIGTYVNIKLYLVDDMYPIGWERMLVSKITGEEYSKIPVEKGIIVNNVSTIYAIYGALKYNRSLTERTVTFAGEMLKCPQNITVKVGTKVSEIIESIGGLKSGKDYLYVAGGPMNGNSIPNDDLIITPNLNCVLVTKRIKESLPLPCIRCGKCSEVCPINLSPVLIKDNLKNKKVLKKLNVQNCIECGACSFICPAGLNVRECVKLAKGVIKK